MSVTIGHHSDLTISPCILVLEVLRFKSKTGQNLFEPSHFCPKSSAANEIKYIFLKWNPSVQVSQQSTNKKKNKVKLNGNAPNQRADLTKCLTNPETQNKAQQYYIAMHSNKEQKLKIKSEKTFR